MKTLIIILFCLFNWVYSYGQTSLDSLLFSKINEYRESKGLNILIWDNTLFKASEHHSKYLLTMSNQDSSKKMYLTHFETKQFEGFKSLMLPEDRYEYYLYSNKNEYHSQQYKYVGKNKYLYPLNKKYIRSVGENASFGYQIGKLNNTIVDYIFNGWMNSKGHREYLENKHIKYGACSIISNFYYSKVKTVDKNGKPIEDPLLLEKTTMSQKIFRVFATFNGLYFTHMQDKLPSF